MFSPRSLSLLLVVFFPLLARADAWPRHTIDASSSGADGVRLADVNGDRLMDITVGWEEGGLVRVYLHPERGEEQDEWPRVTVGRVKSPEDAVFADLDGDGATDVVSSCEGRTRSVFVHWASPEPGRYLESNAWRTESFPATRKQQAWMYALPMQLDGRHGVDLLVGSKGGNASIGWLRSPADPRNLEDWRWSRVQKAGWIMSLVAADMDADEDLDVVVSDRKGNRRGVYWLENPGAAAVRRNAAWTRHEVGSANREVLFLSLGDLDQDGRRDIIAAGKQSLIWHRGTQDGWQEFLIPLPDGVGTGKSAAIGDIDGDGRQDVVFSCEHANGKLSGMRWLSWKNSPTAGSWTSHEIGGPVGLKYDRVVLHDVDGDGDLDVLCCEERDQLGVFWYENPSRGS